MGLLHLILATFLAIAAAEKYDCQNYFHGDLSGLSGTEHIQSSKAPPIWEMNVCEGGKNYTGDCSYGKAWLMGSVKRQQCGGVSCLAHPQGITQTKHGANLVYGCGREGGYPTTAQVTLTCSPHRHERFNITDVYREPAGQPPHQVGWVWYMNVRTHCHPKPVPKCPKELEHVQRVTFNAYVKYPHKKVWFKWGYTPCKFGWLDPCEIVKPGFMRGKNTEENRCILPYDKLVNVTWESKRVVVMTYGHSDLKRDWGAEVRIRLNSDGGCKRLYASESAEAIPTANGENFKFTMDCDAVAPNSPVRPPDEAPVPVPRPPGPPNPSTPQPDLPPQPPPGLAIDLAEKDYY